VKKFIEYPYSELTKVPEVGGIYKLIKNHYWFRTPKGYVLFYGKLFQSPQCNVNERIVEEITKDYGEGDIIFTENAWVKIDISDYC